MYMVCKLKGSLKPSNLYISVKLYSFAQIIHAIDTYSKTDFFIVGGGYNSFTVSSFLVISDKIQSSTCRCCLINAFCVNNSKKIVSDIA